MAIIRTQLVSGQRRIITKVVNGQRRVSCSCCEGEPFCCMYPADELGNLYGADDLPDAVTVNWTNRFTGSMSKSGSGYAGGGATLQVVNGIWQLSDSDGTRNVGRCLIRGDGNLTQGDDLVEDQFADCYKISIGSFFVVNLYRSSLCGWGEIFDFDDPDFEFPDETFSLEFDAENQQWIVRVSGNELSGKSTNTGPQNSPEGSYEGKQESLEVEIDFNLTVSTC
jgi:hypothetical protein